LSSAFDFPTRPIAAWPADLAVANEGGNSVSILLNATEQ
jgi:hypothetical protein